MLSMRERGYLLSIIKHCERIEEKTALTTRETLGQNKDIEEIICFNLLQIGELAKGLSADFISRYSQVPWKNIKGMRDKVAHGYGTIDLDQVWYAAANDVKPLKEYCQRILTENK